jgi:lysine-arginine-ornithine-binding protein
MRNLAAAFVLLATVSAAAAEELGVCVTAGYPPFSEIDDNGRLEGFDIDIAEALCAQIRADCTLVETEWESIIPALEEGKCDAIVASMSITEERRQRIDFTYKYYQTPIMFAARKGVDWQDTDDGMAGKRVCIQSGTIHQAYLEAEFPDVDVVLYPSEGEAILDLVAGRCDAIMASTVTLKEALLDEHEGFAFFGHDHSTPAYHGLGAGIGVRKTDSALRDRLSAAIAAIRANGVYRKINDKYFPVDIYGD